MGILVRKFVLALLVAVLFLGPISWASIRANEKLLSDSTFELQDGTDTLIAGDSHAEVGLEPTHIPRSTSIAISGENYFYTYFKIRYFLQYNPGIRNVILSCGWHNFARHYQDSFLFGDKASTKLAYFPLLDEEGRRTIRRWAPEYLVPLLANDAGLPINFYKNDFLIKCIIIKGILHHDISKGDIPFYGGYRDLYNSRIDKSNIIKKIRIYYAKVPNTSEVEVSSIMVSYFRKIIELCRENSIRVILVNTPVHLKYREDVPCKMISEFDNIIKEAVSVPEVRYVDLTDFSLPESYFLDGDHVNRNGADVVTAVVADILAENGK